MPRQRIFRLPGIPRRRVEILIIIIIRKYVLFCPSASLSGTKVKGNMKINYTHHSRQYDYCTYLHKTTAATASYCIFSCDLLTEFHGIPVYIYIYTYTYVVQICRFYTAHGCFRKTFSRDKNKNRYIHER